MAIENGYCSLAQVKASARITDNVDDDLLELAVEAASREIDQACERVFYNVGNATRIFAARDSFVCEIDDIHTFTTLKTDPESDGNYTVTWANTDFTLEPLNGISGGISQPFNLIRARDTYLFPLENGEPLVQVTGNWGWASIPKAIEQATVILASRIYKRNDSPLGVAGFGDIGVIRVGKLDPDVEALIHPFRKVRMA